MNKSPSSVVVIVAIFALVCVGCLVAGALGFYALYQFGSQVELPAGADPLDILGITPTPPAELTRPDVEAIPGDTLSVLENTVVPINDLRDLACRLEGKCSIPLTLEPPAAPRPLGDRDTFWVTNVDSNTNFQVNAELRYVTDHVYFWVEDGVRVDERELRDLAETFEASIYPTNREFFGSEWSPGVDGDPHIYILYARGLGTSIAGYYSSADEYHPLAHEYSNGHEMFLFNADTVSLSEQFTYGVLAHEFQHMIHWHLDRNEQSWLNEGFSELAAFLNGYGAGGFDRLYIRNPDLQLNDWPNNPLGTSPHYGSSFLFLTYFLDRFGNEATQALVRNPENGLESIDSTLKDISATDPLSGTPIGADDLFIDWAVANYVKDASVGDGRYYYNNYPGSPRAGTTEDITSCPADPGNRSVSQYGVDYIRIACSGTHTLIFEGSTSTRLLPEGAYSGEYAFWSNKGDESNMRLTREFDFTGVSAPIELTYRTWFDIEADYDYLYLEASQDGQNWQILITPSGTAEDPSGNSFGWAYNDTSNGWIEETVDLSRYAGQNIYLRFEYVTDAAVNGEGFLLDDVSIPAIEYFTDFEQGDGGWEAEGFVRVQNVLPQTFRLALIRKGTVTTVEMIPLQADQTAEITVEFDRSVREAILVVSGTTRFTREPATYRIRIIR